MPGPGGEEPLLRLTPEERQEEEEEEVRACGVASGGRPSFPPPPVRERLQRWSIKAAESGPRPR